ncbi:MAG: hypothetical protein ICV53_22730, partial [Flavisolibacter sp.]|nr:hypothetical protein [Flavisolibacter sp.]
MSSQNDIELVISQFSKIEQRLIHDLNARERKGGSRTSFKEKLQQVEGLFSPVTVQRLKKLAAIRNKFAHGDISSLPNRERFIKECEIINKAIDAAKEKLNRSDYQPIPSGTYSPPPRKFHKNINYGDSGQRRLVPIMVLFVFIVAIIAVILQLSHSATYNKKDVSTVLDGTKSLDAPINDQNPYQNKSDFTDAKLTSDKKEILTADVLQKGFKTEFYDEILFCKVKFTNLSDKNITGVRGTLHLYDQSNNVIHSFLVYLDSKYDGSIKAKKSVIKQIGGIGFDDEYNQFNEKDRLFVHTDLSRMRIVWEPEQIVFSDGTAK